MTGIMTLTDTVAGLIPHVDGWAWFIQSEPSAGDRPPWVIVTITNNRVERDETGGVTAAVCHVEIRAAALSTDSVNILCDDRLTPVLQGVIPHADGYVCSCMTLMADSGAYAAGLSADDTSYRYRVRVLQYEFAWSRP